MRRKLQRIRDSLVSKDLLLGSHDDFPACLRMTDCFASFNEPRRPWLDQDTLKAKFLKLSAAAHPDRVHSSTDTEKQAATERYAVLNNAYKILLEPKDRLLHLIELERGTKPTGIEGVPPEIIESFTTVGQLCREVDSFIDERAKVISPLIKVQMFERGMEWIEQLNHLASKLDTHLSTLVAKLVVMNDLWEKAPPLGDADRAEALELDQLEQIYRSLSFVSKWIAQLRERILCLSI